MGSHAAKSQASRPERRHRRLDISGRLRLSDRHLLGNGSGASFANRLNGNYFLRPGVTVFDDGAQDQLTGSAGQDWFFANLFGSGVLDKIISLGKDEIVTEI